MADTRNSLCRFVEDVWCGQWQGTKASLARAVGVSSARIHEWCAGSVSRDGTVVDARPARWVHVRALVALSWDRQQHLFWLNEADVEDGR